MNEMAEMQKEHEKVKEEVSTLSVEIEFERYKQRLEEMKTEHKKLGAWQMSTSCFFLFISTLF